METYDYVDRVKNLKVYQLAYRLALEIHEVTKQFPREELYSLTDQVRRSSRAVFANLAEGYRKRRYEAHFVSKISDADMENTETQSWLDFASDLKYLDESTHSMLVEKSENIGRMLEYLMEHPDKFKLKS